MRRHGRTECCPRVEIGSLAPSRRPQSTKFSRRTCRIGYCIGRLWLAHRPQKTADFPQLTTGATVHARQPSPHEKERRRTKFTRSRDRRRDSEHIALFGRTRFGSVEAPQFGRHGRARGSAPTRARSIPTAASPSSSLNDSIAIVRSLRIAAVFCRSARRFAAPGRVQKEPGTPSAPGSRGTGCPGPPRHRSIHH